MSTPNLNILAPASTTVDAGVTTPIPGVSLSEPGSVAGETFNVTVSDVGGVGILTATGAGVAGVTGSGTTSLTISGSLDQVNADLAALALSEPAALADTIRITAYDSLTGTPASSTINVTSNALVLSIIAPAGLTVIRDQPTAVAGVSLSEPGNVAGETFTAVLTDTHGVLTATGPGVSGSGTDTLTITGSLAQVNAALGTLSDTETSAVGGEIDITATDSLGNKQNLLVAIPVTVTVLTLSIIAPTGLAVIRDQPTAVAGVSLSEPGNVAGETFTAVLTEKAGILTATGPGVSGSGTASLTITGSLAQVNAALATLSDTESSAVGGEIDIAATDSLGNAQNLLVAIPVTVTVQTLSVITPTTLTVTRDQPTAVTGVSLSEPGNVAGETFNVGVGVDVGLILTATGSGVSGSGTDALVLKGSLADVNAALATLSVSGSAAGNYTISILAVDSLSDSGSSLIAVTVKAQTLSIIAPSTLAVTRGQPTAVAGVSLSEPGSILGETFTAVLTDTTGILTATGPGVSGSGTADLTVTGSLAQVNAALATLSDTENAAGSDSIVVNATDSLGNTAPVSTIAVTVTAQTLSILAPSTLTVTAGAATSVVGVSLSEPGSIAGETFTALLTDTTGVLTATGPGVSGSGTAALTVTGSLAQVNAALATLADTEATAGSATIVVNATDSLGDSAGPVDIAVSAPGPVITGPPTLALTFDQLTAVPGVSLTDPTNAANETYTVTVSDAHGILSATGSNVAGDATTALTISGSLTDVNTALTTLFDRSDSPGTDTIAIRVTDSAGIAVRPAYVAVTTTSPALPAEIVSEEDPSRLVTGFGSITDTASGQFGSETSSATATGGLDPSVTASVSVTGSGPPNSDGTATIQIYFEIAGPLLSTVPVIFAGTETTSASAGYFGATAIFTPPGATSGTGIISATYGTGPSGYPASQTFSDTVKLSSDRVYSVTYEAGASGPAPQSGSTGMAQATLDPTITIDPTFAQASDFTLITDNIPCFLAGSHILTERGEVPVEALAVGDRVVTLLGTLQPIVWIGQVRKLITPGRQSDATPVLVRKGALAPNVPHRDLRITKGHSLFIDGVLIPAEFLVNHRSILWDDRTQEVEFYHIELAHHDVLLAEGAAAESYRDDGNRALFLNTDSRWHLPPKPPYAPVLTGGPVVDAVWRRLLDHARPAAPIAMTDDPDLHLLVDGRRMDARRRTGSVYAFPLPRRPNDVRVVSRSGVPSELGLARDPRRLGVALRRIMVWHGARVRLIEAADPLLSPGFHVFEPDNGFRWTNGAGRVPSALFDSTSGPSELELHVGCTTWYPSRSAAMRVAA